MFRLGIILSFFSLFLIEPIEVTWETFADVEFEEKYHEEDDSYYLYPKFGANISALDQQDIKVTGYVIEINPMEGFYVLSRYPMAACFFCGGAGPESIVELDFKEKQSGLTTDSFVTIQGRLKLNEADVYHCNYIIESPKVVD